MKTLKKSLSLAASKVLAVVVLGVSLEGCGTIGLGAVEMNSSSKSTEELLSSSSYTEPSEKPIPSEKWKKEILDVLKNPEEDGIDYELLCDKIVKCLSELHGYDTTSDSTEVGDLCDKLLEYYENKKHIEGATGVFLYENIVLINTLDTNKKNKVSNDNNKLNGSLGDFESFGNTDDLGLEKAKHIEDMLNDEKPYKKAFLSDFGNGDDDNNEDMLDFLTS